MVRGQRRRLRLRPGPQRAPGRPRSPPSWPRPRPRAGAAGKPARRFKDFALDDAGQLEPRAARRRQGRAWTQGEAEPALRRHLAAAAPRSTPGTSTRTSTAPAARWRTGSRSTSSTCSPTAPRPRPCAPTSSGCGSPRWPTCCSARCAASACAHTQLADATCGTIRLKLLKIGALVRTQRAPHQGRHGLGLPVPARVRTCAHLRLPAPPSDRSGIRGSRPPGRQRANSARTRPP